MASQAVFERYELKYMLTAEQRAAVLAAMAPYMQLDQYGKTSIRNVYYDTDTYLLIRRSIEKPVYKEKLRMRSYGQAQPDGRVYVELKKKYKSVVYKRRVSLTQSGAAAWLESGRECPKQGQICDEIGYFLEYYPSLRPRVFLSYEREAYYTREPSDFRVTFDENILARTDRLSLTEETGGVPLLPEGKILMEIKCSGAVPLWMTQVLSGQRIFKTSFSKYGNAYGRLIFPGRFGEISTSAMKEDMYDVG